MKRLQLEAQRLTTWQLTYLDEWVKREVRTE